MAPATCQLYFHPEFTSVRPFLSRVLDFLPAEKLELVPLPVCLTDEYARAFEAVKRVLRTEESVEWLNALWDGIEYSLIPKGDSARDEGLINLAHLSLELVPTDLERHAKHQEVIAQVESNRKTFESLGLDDVPVLICTQGNMMKVLAYPDTSLETVLGSGAEH